MTDKSNSLQSASDERAILAMAIREIRDEQAEFRIELAKNSAMTKKINEMTEEMVDLFAAAKGAFKVLGWIGTLVKWASGIAAAAIALWAAYSHLPPK